MIFPDDTLPSHVQKALDQGNKLEAIGLLCKHNNIGIADSKKIVDLYLSRFPDTRSQFITHNQLPNSVTSALRQGNKQQAIELLRELTGMGLQEAKDAVEAGQILPSTAAIDSSAKDPPGIISLLLWMEGLSLLCYFIFTFIKEYL